MSSPYHLPILLYHRLINGSSTVGRHKIYVKESRFRQQMQWLKDEGYETITFRDLVHNEDQDMTGKIILTFDDGYEDNYTLLFPILKEFDFKAVIFLVTACKRNDWGIAEGEPPLDLMSGEQLREMDAYGIEFGAHTQHHVDLKKSSDEIQGKEITGCFNDLEHLFGKKPVSFSYPFGAYNDHAMKMVSESGFVFGITTIFGPVEWMQNRLCIRRIEIGPNTKMMSFRRKVSGHYLSTKLFGFLKN